MTKSNAFNDQRVWQVTFPDFVEGVKNVTCWHTFSPFAAFEDENG